MGKTEASQAVLASIITLLRAQCELSDERDDSRYVGHSLLPMENLLGVQGSFYIQRGRCSGKRGPNWGPLPVLKGGCLRRGGTPNVPGLQFYQGLSDPNHPILLANMLASKRCWAGGYPTLLPTVVAFSAHTRTSQPLPQGSFSKGMLILPKTYKFGEAGFQPGGRLWPPNCPKAATLFDCFLHKRFHKCLLSDWGTK